MQRKLVNDSKEQWGSKYTDISDYNFLCVHFFPEQLPSITIILHFQLCFFCSPWLQIVHYMPALNNLFVLPSH